MYKFTIEKEIHQIPLDIYKFFLALIKIIHENISQDKVYMKEYHGSVSKFHSVQFDNEKT